MHSHKPPGIEPLRHMSDRFTHLVGLCPDVNPNTVSRGLNPVDLIERKKSNASAGPNHKSFRSRLLTFRRLHKRHQLLANLLLLLGREALASVLEGTLESHLIERLE